MHTSTIKELLTEYDQKRNQKALEADRRKQQIYTKYPEIEEIDQDINALSIQSIQIILTSKDKTRIDSLKKEVNSLKKKRVKLLKENGLSQSDFEPEYECKECKDTGFIKTGSSSEFCSCLKQKIYNIEFNNSNIYDLENQNFEKFSLDYYSNDVDKEKYNSKLSPRENIETILKIVHKFVENFDNPDENNLLFCGNSGLGKTFLSTCIANEMIKKGKTVLYQTAPIMLDKIIDYKFGKSKDNIMESIENADLLIIDDLGTETQNDYKITELFNIINTRILNQNNKITKTIISTNLSLQELYAAYEERLVSRIIGNYNACYFYGDDIRIIKKQIKK